MQYLRLPCWRHLPGLLREQCQVLCANSGKAVLPAFEAMRALSQHGGLGVPEVNVAYGSAEPAWAERYGVGKNLVVDPGENVVSPLGISSFTTMVLDADDHVRLVDRPDKPGYADRIRGAYQALASPSNSEPTKPR